MDNLKTNEEGYVFFFLLILVLKSLLPDIMVIRFRSHINFSLAR